MNQYIWKDVVRIHDQVYAEEHPISGETDALGVYNLDDFFSAVAEKYGVDYDDIETYTMDDIDFDARKVRFGAEDCGCYINGVAEWMLDQRILSDRNEEKLDAFANTKQQLLSSSSDILHGIECHFGMPSRRLCYDCPYGPHSDQCEKLLANELKFFVSLTKMLVTAQAPMSEMPTLIIPNKKEDK